MCSQGLAAMLKLFLFPIFFPHIKYYSALIAFSLCFPQHYTCFCYSLSLCFLAWGHNLNTLLISLQEHIPCLNGEEMRKGRVEEGKGLSSFYLPQAANGLYEKPQQESITDVYTVISLQELNNFNSVPFPFQKLNKLISSQQSLQYGEVTQANELFRVTQTTSAAAHG